MIAMCRHFDIGCSRSANNMQKDFCGTQGCTKDRQIGGRISTEKILYHSQIQMTLYGVVQAISNSLKVSLF